MWNDRCSTPQVVAESCSELCSTTGMEVVKSIKNVTGLNKHMISYQDFENVDIRVGEVVKVKDFPEARKPAYKLEIDFGAEIGIKKSSAQITKHYTKEELLGKLVIAVVNFPTKQIGPFVSEVLTLGLPDENGDVVLLSPTKSVPKGGKMF